MIKKNIKKRKIDKEFENFDVYTPVKILAMGSIASILLNAILLEIRNSYFNDPNTYLVIITFSITVILIFLIYSAFVLIKGRGLGLLWFSTGYSVQLTYFGLIFPGLYVSAVLYKNIFYSMFFTLIVLAIYYIVTPALKKNRHKITKNLIPYMPNYLYWFFWFLTFSLLVLAAIMRKKDQNMFLILFSSAFIYSLAFWGQRYYTSYKKFKEDRRKID